MHDSSGHLLIHTLESSKNRLPLFIVGDVHGCARELAALIEIAKKHLSKFQLVLVGDLFTKGPDPVGIYELIQEHKALCIKGNHDWALLMALRQSQKKQAATFAFHTKQTLHLIRYHKRGICHLLESLPHAISTTVVPISKHKLWEEEYPMYVVHAGIDPVLGLHHTSERMLLTARYIRWDIRDNEKRLVLVPTSGRQEISQIQQGAHSLSDSKEKSQERFRWHDLYQGPELIVFGHDAKQGLFRKALPSGRPICVGIDTGCAYGNSLTGYFPETDLALQVRASRKYFDSKNNLILLKPVSQNITAS